jgi:hypothetical protein
MIETATQKIQYKLSLGQLRAVLFAVQLEAQRYKDIPTRDLPIEIDTLLRARSKLASLVYGVDEQLILMHEWEIFYTAISLEVGRYQHLSVTFPKFMEDLWEARNVVGGMLSEAHAQIKAKVGA